MGLFFFGTKSPISPPSPSPYSHSYFILFLFFCFLSLFPCSFCIAVPYLFPHLIKSKEGMSLWLIQCCSLRSTLKACKTSVKRCGVSSVLWVQHSYTALTGLCQCSWTGRGKICDGIDHSAKINRPPLARGIWVCKCQHFVHKRKDTG